MSIINMEGFEILSNNGGIYANSGFTIYCGPNAAHPQSGLSSATNDAGEATSERVNWSHATVDDSNPGCGKASLYLQQAPPGGGNYAEGTSMAKQVFFPLDYLDKKTDGTGVPEIGFKYSYFKSSVSLKDFDHVTFGPLIYDLALGVPFNALTGSYDLNFDNTSGAQPLFWMQIVPPTAEEAAAADENPGSITGFDVAIYGWTPADSGHRQIAESTGKAFPVGTWADLAFHIKVNNAGGAIFDVYVDQQKVISLENHLTGGEGDEYVATGNLGWPAQNGGESGTQPAQSMKGFSIISVMTDGATSEGQPARFNIDNIIVDDFKLPDGNIDAGARTEAEDLLFNKKHVITGFYTQGTQGQGGENAYSPGNFTMNNDEGNANFQVNIQGIMTPTVPLAAQDGLTHVPGPVPIYDDNIYVQTSTLPDEFTTDVLNFNHMDVANDWGSPTVKAVKVVAVAQGSAGTKVHLVVNGEQIYEEPLSDNSFTMISSVLSADPIDNVSWNPDKVNGLSIGLRASIIDGG